MELRLFRESYTDEYTIGTLTVERELMFRTLELPWLGNKRTISCIPEGKYNWEIRYSARFGKHIHIKDVKDRTLILIHVGNTTSEIAGCVIIGTKRGKIKNKEAVMNSRKAMITLLQKIGDTKKGTITIVSAREPIK